MNLSKTEKEWKKIQPVIDVMSDEEKRNLTFLIKGVEIGKEMVRKRESIKDKEVQ